MTPTTNDYQKITLRGTIAERAKWHRRRYRSQSFTTFKVTIKNKKGKLITIPVITYGRSAVNAAMNFRAGLRIMVFGEIDLDPTGDLIVVSKFFRFGRLADEK